MEQSPALLLQRAREIKDKTFQSLDEAQSDARALADMLPHLDGRDAAQVRDLLRSVGHTITWFHSQA